MSERGFTGIFLAALLLAGLATFGVYRFITERAAEARAAEVTTRPVVVATADITEGGRLTAGALSLRSFTSEAVPQGAFEHPDSLVGRVVRFPIFAGEAVTESKLAPTGASGGLEVKIRPGYRAMAIPVNEHIGISGFIQPNARVDVIVTLRPGRSSGDRISKVFLQNMRVLSVGEHIRRGDDGKPMTANTVTLEVSPEEAEMLAVAMNEGVLQLALRGYGDADSTLTKGAAPAQVLAAARKIEEQRPRTTRVRPRPKPQPPPQPAPTVSERATMKVQIFRGTELTEETLELGEDSTKTDERSKEGKKP